MAQFARSFPAKYTFRGPRGRTTECPSGAIRLRFPRPVQRFVAPWGAPSTVPVAQSACSSPV
eukprot:3479177-Pyramimonas_sp.AAC.1